MSDNEFGDFAPPKEYRTIEREGYRGEEGSSFPIVNYLVKEFNPPRPGFFAISQDKVAQPSGWIPYDVPYGNFGNQTLEPSWVTMRLRGLFLGERRGWKFKMPSGNTLYLPWNERWPENWKKSGAKIESRIQVLTYLYEEEFSGFVTDINPVVLVFNRRSRSDAWKNNQETGRADLPHGILPSLVAYAARATKFAQEKHGYAGDDFNWLGTWWSDLVPETEGNEGKVAIFHQFGESPFNVPIIDMRTKGEKMPKTRFASEAIRDAYPDFYDSIVKPWEQEPGWGSASEVEGRDDENGTIPFDDSGPIGVEEDEIPF